MVALALAHSVVGTPFLTNYSSCRDVRAIIPDGSSLWLASSGGLVYLSCDTCEPRLYSIPVQIPDVDLTAAIRTRDGKIWLGSAGGYVTEFTRSTQHFSSYNGLHAVGWDITCLAEYKEYLLIGSSQGLSVFSRTDGRVAYNARRFGTFAGTLVKEVATYGDTIAVLLPEGIAWMAPSDIRRVNLNVPDVWHSIDTTGVEGLLVDGSGFHLYQGTVQRSGGALFELHGDQTSVVRNGQQIGSFPYKVYCAVQNGENVYIGTKGQYAYILYPDGRAPKQIVVSSPPGADFRSCALDQDGCLWAVTDHISEGIGVYSGDRWRTIKSEDDAPGIGQLAFARPGSMDRVFVTSTNDVWVGSFGYGAKWFRRSTGTWKHYHDSVAVFHTDPSPIVRFDADPKHWWASVASFCEDSLGFIWMGNAHAYNGNVVHVFDPSTEQWRSLNKDSLGFSGTSVHSLEAAHDRETDRHFVYIGFATSEAGAGSGLSVVGFQGSPMTAVMDVTNHPTYVSVNDIDVVNDSLAWVATSDGLYRVKRSHGTAFEIKKADMAHATPYLFAVACAPNGRPVFAMGGDLWEYRDSAGNYGEPVAYNLTRSGLLNGPVYRIFYDRSRSAYWLNTGAGLYLFHPGEYPARETRKFRQVAVYPNPFSRTKGTPRLVVFDRMPPNSRVSLYDMAGKLVWASAAPGSGDSEDTHQRVTWDGRNSHGMAVMPGSYFYYIEADDRQRHVGKLLVIP